MYLSETDILRKAVKVVEDIVRSDEYCTVDAVNGALLLLDALIEEEGN